METEGNTVLRQAKARLCCTLSVWLAVALVLLAACTVTWHLRTVYHRQLSLVSEKREEGAAHWAKCVDAGFVATEGFGKACRAAKADAAINVGEVAIVATLEHFFEDDLMWFTSLGCSASPRCRSALMSALVGVIYVGKGLFIVMMFAVAWVAFCAISSQLSGQAGLIKLQQRYNADMHTIFADGYRAQKTKHT